MYAYKYLEHYSHRMFAKICETDGTKNIQANE